MNNIFKTFFLLIIFFSPVADAIDPLQAAGGIFVDPWWNIVGIPTVHPDSEGHLIQNFGPFEYDSMNAGDWAMAKCLPEDNVVIVSTHGPRLPLQDYLACKLANKTRAYYNIDSSCSSGDRSFFLFKPSASKLAKETNRPTIGFKGPLAVGVGVIKTNGVTVHYPDGRVVPLKHPDRLFKDTKITPATSGKGSKAAGCACLLDVAVLYAAEKGNPWANAHLESQEELNLMYDDLRRGRNPDTHEEADSYLEFFLNVLMGESMRIQM